MKNCTREGSGPPQLYGRYLHASALLVARLGIVCWVAALIATAVLISRALPFEGFLAKVPYLDLLICIGAIVSEYADDISTDMSVSRRSSLQRKKSDTGSILTLPTEDIFRLGDPEFYEKAVYGTKQPKSVVGDNPKGAENPPMREDDDALPLFNPVVPVAAPPTPKVSDPTADPAVPEPVYCPGGWRAEWSNTTQEVGMPGIREVLEGTVDSSNWSSPSATQYTPATAPPSIAQSSPQAAQPPAPSSDCTCSTNTSKSRRHSSQRPATASTSIASSAARSNLSTVRYAAEPEIAVRQAIRVVPNPAYQPPEERQGAGGGENPIVNRPDPVVLLRNAQSAQKSVSETGGPQRKPSNFSRPMLNTDTQGDKEDKVDSGVERRPRAAYVEDENGVTE
ncbi:hypothetical protein CIB48_g1984 [Xylaria polymorpha]|nr:hypothetical protein CIB48_g1984 [Xylaria polymorpha]